MLGCCVRIRFWPEEYCEDNGPGVLMNIPLILKRPQQGVSSLKGITARTLTEIPCIESLLREGTGYDVLPSKLATMQRRSRPLCPSSVLIQQEDQTHSRGVGIRRLCGSWLWDDDFLEFPILRYLFSGLLSWEQSLCHPAKYRPLSGIK